MFINRTGCRLSIAIVIAISAGFLHTPAKGADIYGLWPGELSAVPNGNIKIPGRVKISDLAWSPYGDQIAVAVKSPETAVYVINTEDYSKKAIARYPSPTSNFGPFVAYNPAGDRLVIDNGDLWIHNLAVDSPDTMIPRELSKKDGNPDRAQPVAWNMPGVITYGAGTSLFQLFEDNRTKVVAENSVSDSGTITSMKWSPDGKKLATGGLHSDIYIKDEKALKKYKFDGYDPVGVTWSPDGNLLGVTTKAGAMLVSLSAMAAGQGLVPGKTILKLTDKVYDRPISWSPDGTKIAVVAEEGTVTIYQLTALKGKQYEVQIDKRIKPKLRDHFNVYASVEEKSAMTGSTLNRKKIPAGFARVDLVDTDGTARIILTPKEGAPEPKVDDVEQSLADFVESSYADDALNYIELLRLDSSKDQYNSASSMVNTYSRVWPNGQYSSELKSALQEKLRRAATYSPPTKPAVQLNSVNRGSSAPIPPALLSPTADDGEWVKTPAVQEIQDATQTAAAIEYMSLVPIRPLAEWLGASIKYNEHGTKAQVMLNWQGHTSILTVGSRIVETDGVKKVLTAQPIVIRNTTLVPLSYVTDNFGVSVTLWDEARRELVMSTDGNTSQIKLPYSIPETLPVVESSKLQ